MKDSREVLLVYSYLVSFIVEHVAEARETLVLLKVLLHAHDREHAE